MLVFVFIFVFIFFILKSVNIFGIVGIFGIDVIDDIVGIVGIDGIGGIIDDIFGGIFGNCNVLLLPNNDIGINDIFVFVCSDINDIANCSTLLSFTKLYTIFFCISY